MNYCACGCGKLLKAKGTAYLRGHTIVVISQLPVIQAKLRARRLQLWQDSSYRESIIRRGTQAKQRPEIRKKYSLAVKQLWQDPVYRARQIASHKRAMLNSETRKRMFRRRVPSYFEDLVIPIVKKFDLPYVYTGNGSRSYGNRTPDFVHLNGRTVVEVYGIKHKKEVCGIEDYESDRTAHYAQFGLEVLFLNEKDLLREDVEEWCRTKLGEGPR